MDLTNATFNNHGSGPQIIAENYYAGRPTVQAAESIRESLETLKSQVGNNRQWFSVVKVLMWKGYVNDGDFAGAAALICEVLPDVRLDAKDLSRLNVQSFSKPLDKWDVGNAPVQGNVFIQYRDIAAKAMERIPDKEE